jgi:prepilin-type N-terminal cleavage/methylation domain-containing protein
VKATLRDESGFTLVELLIAVVVMGMIVTVIGAAVNVGLRTMDDTSNRLTSSTDAQLLSIYLPKDVQSASVAVTSGITCSGASNPKLQLSDGANFNIVYGVQAVTDGFQLERHVCTGGSVQSTVIVGRNLASTTAAVGTRIPSSGTLVGASLTITGKTSTNEPDPYVFTVTGRRRT